jgi:16S rRNA (uracil1498-N3)-methyltransferase
VVRIWVTGDLEAGERITASAEQAHYLLNVMRLSVGDEALLFNGRDGEWTGRIVEAPKRGCVLEVEALTRPQTKGPDLELVVALVKRTALETIVEKAVELGAARIRLVVTEHANRDHARADRLRAIAAEAAEQTGRLDAPAVVAPEPLLGILADWPPHRALMFCDEAGDAPPALQALSGRPGGAWAVLIGPEGGFSAAERAAIRALPAAVPVSLGPRILRADTAAVCALTLWQAALGDLKAS